MKTKALAAGAILTVYGLLSVLFEVLVNSFNTLTLWLWTILNPLFVFFVTSGGVQMSFYQNSIFFDASTEGLANATLFYWGWPIVFLAIGLMLFAAGSKR